MWQIESVASAGSVVSPTGHVHLPFHVRLADGEEIQEIMAVLPAAPSERGDEDEVRARLQVLLSAGWTPADVVLES